jgi:hypothetical protein
MGANPSLPSGYIKSLTIGSASSPGRLTVIGGALSVLSALTGNRFTYDPVTGDMHIGDDTNYLDWNSPVLSLRGSLNADDIVAGTLTGRVVKAKGSGVGTDVWIDSDGKVKFYYGGTSYGSIWMDSNYNLIYDANTAHQFFNIDTSIQFAQFNTDGLTLPSNKKIQFSGGTTITDVGSEVQIDRQTRVAGTVYPSSDDTHNNGDPSKRWANVYARIVWQSVNTDGSRKVYDFGYVEKGLINDKLLKRAEKKNKGMQNTNGYVPGLVLPFKVGSVLKWTEKGLKYSDKQNDFVVGIADENGLPIIMGAEPVRVIGKAKIGDFIVPSDTKGCAMAIPRDEYFYGEDCIGRCLENKKDNKERLIKVIIKF